MSDLSVPFKKILNNDVTKAVVEELSTSNINWKIWIGGIIIALGFYYFFISTPSMNPKPQQQQQQQQQQSKVDYLRLANNAFQQFRNTGKVSCYIDSIENYTEALKEITDPTKQGYIYFQLATLYHEGVPQSNEVPPDAQSAIFFYREAIKQGYHAAVLPLASVYHWGLAKFEGNRDVAKHLYGVILKVGTDYEKGLAKDRLRQMREENGETVGTNMMEEDNGVSGSFSTATLGNNPYGETFMNLNQSTFAAEKALQKDIDEKYVDDLIQNKLKIDENQRKDNTRKPNISAFSDPQNARDHVVVNSAKQSLERLRANTHLQYDVPTTFKMIHEYIVKKSELPTDKRETAAHVLREMSKGISNVGYEQSKEIEALQLVWNRIQSQVYASDTDKRKSLMENLVNELAESIEYGDLVCSTGRLNRIIDTLNFQDPLVNIQPKWAVQQMMVARAGVIQKSLLTKSSSEVRDAMDARTPSARQRQLQEEFMQKVRSAIERDLTRTYVDTGMMSKDLLKTELDAWIL